MPCSCLRRHGKRRHVLTCQKFIPSDCHPDRVHWAKGLCRNCYTTAFRRRTPARLAAHARSTRSVRLQKRYGIDDATYASMSASQGGVCAICGRACATGRRLAVDHKHGGKVRGLLCRRCNQGIGQFSESSVVLRAAADYLDRFNAVEAQAA